MDVPPTSQIILHLSQGEFYEINIKMDCIMMKNYNIYVSIILFYAFYLRETNCNMATKFDAYIFYHRNETEIQQILQSLGQGFQRTHFAV